MPLAGKGEDTRAHHGVGDRVAHGVAVVLDAQQQQGQVLLAPRRGKQDIAERVIEHRLCVFVCVRARVFVFVFVCVCAINGDAPSLLSVLGNTTLSPPLTGALFFSLLK